MKAEYKPYYEKFGLNVVYYRKRKKLTHLPKRGKFPARGDFYTSNIGHWFVTVGNACGRMTRLFAGDPMQELRQSILSQPFG